MTLPDMSSLVARGGADWIDENPHRTILTTRRCPDLRRYMVPRPGKENPIVSPGQRVQVRLRLW